MKKLIFMFIVCFAVSFVHAQNTAKLQGPAAKNAKPWQKNAAKKSSAYQVSKATVQGPAAKNAKPWTNTNQQQGIEVATLERSNLQGPKAKNYKPWLDKNRTTSNQRMADSKKANHESKGDMKE